MFRVNEQQFRACKIFSDAEQDTIQYLCNAAQPVFYRKNQQIIEQKDRSTDFHLIVSGTVRAKGLSPEGKEVTYGEIGPGCLFGEFAALDNDPRSSSVIAIEDVHALKMPSTALLNVVESDGKVALKLLLSLVEKSRKQTERIYEFTVLAVRQRIQHEILRLANVKIADCNDQNPDGPIVVEIPTHQELANRLSTHREAITRELRHLASAGYIKSNKHTLLIQDYQKLAEYAGTLTDN